MNLVDPFWTAPAPPPGDLLADPFDDSSFDTSKWVRRLNDPHIALTETSVLTIDYDGTDSAAEAIDSVHTYDVRGRTMQMHLAGYLPFGNMYFIWQTPDNSKYVGISLSVLTPQYNAVSDTTGIFMENLALHGYEWMRIVHTIATDHVDFYLSNDGVTWSSSFGNISGVDAHMDLSNVKVNLQGYIGIEPGHSARQQMYSHFRLF